MIETNKNKAEGTLYEVLSRMADEQHFMRKDIKKLVRYGIGAAFITGITVLGIKIDQNKNYYKLNQGVEYTQRQVEVMQEQQYIIVQPCVEEINNNVYEVTPCTAKTEE